MIMPYATARDTTRLYFEEAGSGSAILFVHEFAADYASWEPQMRYFARRHRCITYSARGYTPSETPAADAFTYQHFRDDALAVLDHLGIERAHLVGLSMGAYSSLQVGLLRPERVLSLTLAGIGTGS
jgi:3-oxoadipate enol-lactonase